LFSESVFKTPDIVDPLDCKADITFLAGDCNIVITSPINSSLDLILAKNST
jgi:hypothetical protein